MRYCRSGQKGFTLIETMIAMAVFTIGILALFGMQTAAIKENLAANNITTGSTWASDQVERLIALDYDDPEISENIVIYKPCGDFDSAEWWPSQEEYDKDAPDPKPIHREDYPGETFNQTNYYVYWAVSRDCTLTKEGDIGLDDDSEYRPKHLFIAVTRENGNGEQEVTAQFSYIKQNMNY